MRVCHISTTDLAGGASRAGYRIHRSLLEAGCASSMIVRKRTSEEPEISDIDGFVRMAWDGVQRNIERRMLSRHNIRPAAGCTGLLPGYAGFRVRRAHVDLFHLHWIGAGLMSAAQIGRLDRPVIWTFHDLWAVLGGLYYYGLGADLSDRSAIIRYEEAVSSSYFASTCRERFRAQWRGKRIHAVAPSTWIAREVGKHAPDVFASLSVIPYAIDLKVYSPGSRQAARESLGLPSNATLILSGATGFDHDLRKGGDLLYSSLDHIDKSSGAVLVTFGGSEPSKNEIGGRTVIHLGPISSEAQMAQVYRAADVFVAPSREDNLPNTVLEASACGTPTVAFDIGGMSDMIRDGITGRLVEPFSVKELADGILWASETPSAGKEARALAEAQNRPSSVARSYLELYHRALDD